MAARSLLEMGSVCLRRLGRGGGASPIQGLQVPIQGFAGHQAGLGLPGPLVGAIEQLQLAAIPTPQLVK